MKSNRMILRQHGLIDDDTLPVFAERLEAALEEARLEGRINESGTSDAMNYKNMDMLAVGGFVTWEYGKCEDCQRELYAGVPHYCEQKAKAELLSENTFLRAALANSKDPCMYCQLPAEDIYKCSSGFPGCGRADDMSGCPEFGAAMELHDMRKALSTAKAEQRAADVRWLDERGWEANAFDEKDLADWLKNQPYDFPKD